MVRSDSMLAGVIRFVTAVSALICAGVLFVGPARNVTDISIELLQFLVIPLAVLIPVLETQSALITMIWTGANNLSVRGLLQISVAMMTELLADVSAEGGRSVLLLLEYTPTLLMCCGLIYVIAGLSTAFLKSVCWRESVSREQATRDLQVSLSRYAGVVLSERADIQRRTSDNPVELQPTTRNNTGPLGLSMSFNM